MAKTVDEIARETLGSFALENAMLREENKMLQARVAELTPKPAGTSPALKLDANPNVPISEFGHVEFSGSSPAPEGGT